LTDITVRFGRGTHQIDHVVCGRDQLYVIETKTWHGTVEGRAGDRYWTLSRPRGRPALRIYNPLLQNRTHANVIASITGVPVSHLVVSAAFIRVPDELAGTVATIPGLPALLGPPGRPAGRIDRAFIDLTRRKAAWGQRSLSKAHRNWMAHGRRFDPVRSLWVTGAVSLGCALYAAHRLFLG
jgi:hypothetical protein